MVRIAKVARIEKAVKIARVVKAVRVVRIVRQENLASNFYISRKKSLKNALMLDYQTLTHNLHRALNA